MTSTGYRLPGNPKSPSRKFLAQYPLPLRHRYRGGFPFLSPQTGPSGFQLFDQLDYCIFCFRAAFCHFSLSLFSGYDSFTQHYLLTRSRFSINVPALDALYDYDGGGSLPLVIAGDIAFPLPLSLRLYISPPSSVSMYYYYRKRI